MTKDDKEFFDKAVLAAITGLSARPDINYVAGDAISIAESALGERNHYLAASGYQEPPQAETLPGIFGCAPMPKQAARGYKEHLHGGFGTAELGAEATNYIPTTTKDAEPYAISSHEIPADVSLCTSTGIPVRLILEAASQNKGRKVTATELYWLVYPAGPSMISSPTIHQLRDIGRVMRDHGYQIKRSGGKDLYQL